MRAKLVADLDPQKDRDKWLEHRRSGIGSSDAAAIANFSKWASPYSVYLDKLGKLPPTEASQQMEWGNRLEAVIAQKYAEEHNALIIKRGTFVRHPEIPYLMANTDFWILDEKILEFCSGLEILEIIPEEDFVRKVYPYIIGAVEIKNSNAYSKDDWSGSRVPDYYWIQVQHQLAITGLPWIDMAVLIGGCEFHEPPRIYRDEAVIKDLLTIERNFWEGNVLKQIPPAITAHEKDGEAIGQLHPEDDGTELLLPETAGDLIAQWDKGRAMEKEGKALKDEAANKLKDMIGDHRFGIFDERRADWNRYSTRRVDSQRLKKEQPELYYQYSKESNTSKFEILGGDN